MNKLINPCSIYLGIRCLYALQGVFYTSGGIISKTLLLVFLLLSIYYIYLTFSKYKFPLILKGVTLLFTLLFTYGACLLFSNNEFYAAGMPVPKFEYLKSILLSFAPIYACFHFAKQKLLNDNNIRIWVFLFLITATLSYFSVENQVMMDTGNDEITNNMAYSFVAILPSIFLFHKKPIIQYLILCYCLMFILLGMKRGAVIIGLFALIYFLYSNRHVVQKKHKILTYALTIGIITFIIYEVNSLLITNEYFLERIDSTMEGDSSNRDELYSYFWSHFKNETSIIDFLFGHGANGTLAIYIDYAHNDWLELAINQGVLGLSIYIIYWFIFIKSIRVYHNNKLMKNFLVMFLIIFLIKSLFSMSYTMGISATAVLGYMLGTYDMALCKKDL